MNKPKIEYEIHYNELDHARMDTATTKKKAQKLIRKRRKEDGVKLEQIDVYVFRHIDARSFMARGPRRKTRAARRKVASPS